jgi:hypothetical protein
MSDQKRVKIRYKPRDQFRPFHSRKQRWSALVCHRRAGKTVATLNDLIRGQSTSVSMRAAMHSSSRGAIRPKTRRGAICGVMQSRCWQSHPINPTCVSTSSMAR